MKHQKQSQHGENREEDLVSGEEFLDKEEVRVETPVVAHARGFKAKLKQATGLLLLSGSLLSSAPAGAQGSPTQPTSEVSKVDNGELKKNTDENLGESMKQAFDEIHASFEKLSDANLGRVIEGARALNKVHSYDIQEKKDAVLVDLHSHFLRQRAKAFNARSEKDRDNFMNEPINLPLLDIHTSFNTYQQDVIKIKNLLNSAKIKEKFAMEWAAKFFGPLYAAGLKKGALTEKHLYSAFGPNAEIIIAESKKDQPNNPLERMSLEDLKRTFYFYVASYNLGKSTSEDENSQRSREDSPYQKRISKITYEAAVEQFNRNAVPFFIESAERNSKGFIPEHADHERKSKFMRELYEFLPNERVIEVAKKYQMLEAKPQEVKKTEEAEVKKPVVYGPVQKMAPKPAETLASINAQIAGIVSKYSNPDDMPAAVKAQFMALQRKKATME